MIDIKALQKAMKNTLNRTLTKVAKEQKNALKAKYGIKAKHLHARRLTRQRATNDNLEIKLFSTKKYITPFMLERGKRPRPSGWGTQRNRASGGKFYIKSRPSGVSGWSVKSGVIDKRPYSYIEKLKDLDEAAIELNDELFKKAQDIFAKELEKEFK